MQPGTNRVSRPETGEKQTRRTVIAQSAFDLSVAEHVAWRTGSPNGQRANFSYCDLSSLTLPASVDLSGALFVGAELSNLVFLGTNLTRCDFTDAIFSDTSFADCVLIEASFSNAKGLLDSQFPGADLTGVNLPAGLTFEHFSKTISNTEAPNKVLVSLLTGCLSVLLYSWTTPDYSLIANTPARGVSLGGATLSYVALAVVIPVALLFGFLYLQLQLQRLWFFLGAGPRLYPDGLPLPSRISTWATIEIVLFRTPRHLGLRLAVLDRAVNIFLALGIVPLALAVVWLRCLVCHNWYLSALQGFLFTCSLLIAFSSSELGRLTVEGVNTGLNLWVRRVNDVPPFARHAIVGFVMFAVVAGAGSAAILIPLSRAYLVDEEVSTKPGEWIDSYGPGSKNAKGDEQFGRVKGIDFRGRDLRWCYANRSFLVKANLVGTTLLGADLRAADLRFANLEGADLKQTQLDGALVDEARLTNADLRGVDLRGVLGLKRDQIVLATTDQNTRLPKF